MIEDVLDNVELAILMPKEGAFILNTSFLDGDDLLAEEPGDSYEWTEVLCESSEINITRGLNLNQNVLATAQASELVATVHGPRVDPLKSERFIPNTSIRVRVFVDATWETLFIGNTAQTKALYSKERTASVTFIAHDFIKELSNIQGASPDEESYEDRLTALADLASTTITVDGGVTTLSPLVNYQSIWDIMNIAAASEGGVVFPTRTGELKALGRDATQPSNLINFEDTGHTSPDPLHACFTDIDVSYDTTNVINSLTITNISDYDENGDIEEEMPVYTDEDSTQSYGQFNVTLTTNLPTESAVESLRDYIFLNYIEPKRRVETLTYSPDEYWQTLVDTGDYVGLLFHDADDAILFDNSFLVTSVTHTIVPDSWTTNLGLFIT